MSAIVDIIGRKILDSRGNPTVECNVLLESGVMGWAAVPFPFSVLVLSLGFMLMINRSYG